MSLQPLQRIEEQDPDLAIIRKRIVTSFLLWGGLAVFSLFLGGAIGLIIAPLAVGWIILQTIIALYHRTQIEGFQHYRQTEALLSLHALIDIRYPLPPLRLWVISPDFAALLATYIRQHQPKTIVELGSGASTVIGGYALEQTPGGHIYSIEHLREFVDSSQRTLQKHGLSDAATIIHAPLTPYHIADETPEDGQDERRWYDTTQFGHITEIDLLVVDGPPEDTYELARYPAMRFFYDRLNDGALIIIDDAMREHDYTMINRWLDEFDLEVVEHLANEKGAAILRKTAHTSVLSSENITSSEEDQAESSSSPK